MTAAPDTPASTPDAAPDPVPVSIPDPVPVSIPAPLQARYEPPETADRWIDLDAAIAARERHRTRYPLLFGVAGLVALLTGAAFAAVTRDEPPPPPPPVIATVTLDTAVLVPAPSALLVLHLANLGAGRETVREVRVSGGGVAETSVPVGRDLAPADTVEVRLAPPLRCPDPRTVAERITVTVRLTAGDGGAADGLRAVQAVGIGPAGELGGICTVADVVLPEGWRSPARAATWQLTGTDLDLTVTDLPEDATRVLWVEADGVLLPQPRSAPEIDGGSARLVLGAPAPGCRDGGVRPVVPSGLQLHVQTPERLRTVYVPVGATVAQWLMDAFARACPARPEGPPAVLSGGG